MSDLRDQIAGVLLPYVRSIDEERSDESGYTPLANEIAVAVLAVVQSELDLSEALQIQAVDYVDNLNQQIAEADATIERVRELHRPHEFEHCIGCGITSDYPCPTIRALDQPQET